MSLLYNIRTVTKIAVAHTEEVFGTLLKGYSFFPLPFSNSPTVHVERSSLNGHFKNHHLPSPSAHRVKSIRFIVQCDRRRLIIVFMQLHQNIVRVTPGIIRLCTLGVEHNMIRTYRERWTTNNKRDLGTRNTTRLVYRVEASAA